MLLDKSRSTKEKVRGIVLVREAGNGRSLRREIWLLRNQILVLTEVRSPQGIVYSNTEVRYRKQRGGHSEHTRCNK